jgi:uroporphyrinogen III methyltransferase/synthase
MVTRPREQAHELGGKLAQLGAEVLLQPAIEISDPPDWLPMDGALERLSSYDWIVFSSANGVHYFLNRLRSLFGDFRRLGGSRIAVIGPGTAEELAHYHVQPDLVPRSFRAESLAESLQAEAKGRRFLLVRASRGREVLYERLTAAGGQVEQIVAYTNADVSRADPQIVEALANRRIDWVTVTSSTIARSLVRLFREDLRRSRLASISPVTSAALHKLGYPPTAEAAEYTMDGIVACILQNADRPLSASPFGQ